MKSLLSFQVWWYYSFYYNISGSMWGHAYVFWVHVCVIHPCELAAPSPNFFLYKYWLVFAGIILFPLTAFHSYNGQNSHQLSIWLTFSSFLSIIHLKQFIYPEDRGGMFHQNIYLFYFYLFIFTFHRSKLGYNNR